MSRSNENIIGILAHVDAGKTTLTEAVLYRAGAIRRLGRVDKKDSWFDSHELERNRGITIFSKQNPFCLGDKKVTLVDTPGHVDFSAEMERTLGIPPEGDFVDAEGNVLGRHRGIHRYTVGQRKGLGIALGYPAYVSRIDAEQNRVVLAAAGGEYRQEIVLRDCLWHAPMPAVFDAQVKVRHTKRPAAARVTLGEENRAEITFAEPVRAPAPGQTAAIQQEGFVIGCGYIGDAET